jgi:small ligand-binding sensory domain FIST
MAAFLTGHATHSDWRMATELALSQLDRGRRPRVHPQLGLVYVSTAFAKHFHDIRELLDKRLPQVQWSGACTPGVCADDAEYLDEPAVAILLGELPAGSVQSFGAAWEDSGSNAERLVQQGASLLLHADPSADGVADRIAELTASVAPGLVFGGMVEPVAIALEPDGSTAHGLSGLCLSPEVPVLSRMSHGCSPIAREHLVTASHGQSITELDGRPALEVMLDDLNLSFDERDLGDPRRILRRLRETPTAQGLLIGIASSLAPRSAGFGGHRISGLLGIEPQSRAVVASARPSPGDRAVFCRRDPLAARTDLIRVCTELREEVEASGLTVRGAHYVSCVARGRRLFGSSGAELALVRHNLGEVPLAGFFAHGEIADGRLHGYSAVLTLFVQAA